MHQYEGKENLDVMHSALNYNNEIFKMISGLTENGLKIVDFGAGMGEFCNRFENKEKIFAVEIDKFLSKKIQCQTLSSIDEIDQKVDFIYAINVLEHLKDDNEYIKKFYDKLNNNGKLFIFVPARQELFSNMDALVGHFRRYNKEGLRFLLGKQNFKILRFGYFDFLGYFISLVYKLLRKNGTISEKQIIFYDRYIFPLSRLFDKLTFGSIIGKNLLISAVKNEEDLSTI